MPKYRIYYHATINAYNDVEASSEEEARDLFKYFEDDHDLISDQYDGTDDIIDEIEEIKEN